MAGADDARLERGLGLEDHLREARLLALFLSWWWCCQGVMVVVVVVVGRCCRSFRLRWSFLSLAAANKRAAPAWIRLLC